MREVFDLFVTETLNLPIDSKLDIINNKLTTENLEEGISEGFNLFILISKLADDYPPAQYHLKEKTFYHDEFKAFNFFKLHTGRIEVMVGNVLTRTYFPIQPSCKYISNAKKDSLM